MTHPVADFAPLPARWRGLPHWPPRKMSRVAKGTSRTPTVGAPKVVSPGIQELILRIPLPQDSVVYPPLPLSVFSSFLVSRWIVNLPKVTSTTYLEVRSQGSPTPNARTGILHELRLLVREEPALE
jgi:hypothetical protein